MRDAERRKAVGQPCSKEQYERAQMEIVKFDAEDVITASNGTSDNIKTPFVPAGK